MQHAQQATLDRPAHVPDELVVDFDMYAQKEIGTGFHEAWAMIRSAVSPLVWTPRNEGHWLLTDPALFSEVYNNTQLFSSHTIIIPKSHGASHDLIPTTMDPPEHQPYKLILNRLLAPPVIARLSDSVRSATRQLIDDIVARGQCEFTVDFAQKLPLHVFMALMDLPREDIAKVKYWSDQTTHPDGSMSFADALQHLYDYLEPYIVERQKNPGDDFISALVNAEVNGHKVSDSEARKLSVQLLIAGVDTVVNFLSFAFLKLAKSPERQAAFVRGDVDSKTLAEQLLMELPLVTVGRLVTEDTQFHGITLKAGDMVALPTPIATDFELSAGQAAGNNTHLTFGQGPHMCPGRNLARMEIQIVLEEWFNAIPTFQLAKPNELAFGGGIVGIIQALDLSWPSAA